MFKLLNDLGFESSKHFTVVRCIKNVTLQSSHSNLKKNNEIKRVRIDENEKYLYIHFFLLIEINEATELRLFSISWFYKHKRFKKTHYLT